MITAKEKEAGKPGGKYQGAFQIFLEGLLLIELFFGAVEIT